MPSVLTIKMYVCMNMNKNWKDLLLYSLMLIIAVLTSSELFPLLRRSLVQ